jgi:hypothetical protein
MLVISNASGEAAFKMQILGLEPETFDLRSDNHRNEADFKPR